MNDNNDGLTAAAMLRAVESAFTEKAREYALVQIHDAYFQEYTDATEMDPAVAGAFEQVFNLLFPAGETPSYRELEDFLSRSGLEKPRGN